MECWEEAVEGGSTGFLQKIYCFFNIWTLEIDDSTIWGKPEKILKNLWRLENGVFGEVCQLQMIFIISEKM